jgi:eukaryotic translation initiation factor 2C
MNAANSDMPAINCGTSDRPMWCLPETLQILPYQIFNGKVPSTLTSNMI